LNVLNVVAVSPSGGTAHATRTVEFDFVPGTILFDVTDPNGDDNGPGNYAYPTSGDFHAGAFDMQRFQVIDGGANGLITFRVQVRDLSPTFGSPLGAQLVDVYVRDPSASAANTSTAASFPQRNYVIDPASAWSQLIEVQGFGQRYVDAHGTTLGTVSIRAKCHFRASFTFSVPKSTLGTPASGWGFTVVLTGQDGFSPDQARGFQATPQAFHLACAPPRAPIRIALLTRTRSPKPWTSSHRRASARRNELDYTLHNPVSLQGWSSPSEEVPPPLRGSLAKGSSLFL